jgi:hypothetical protein
MIRNFASEIAYKPLREGRVHHFVNRNKNHLILRWSSGIDFTRSKADSHFKYKLYFDLLHRKVTECKRLDLCWPQWVHFGLQEHHRTSWNPTEPHGISWKVLEHGGIFWLLTNDYK